MEVPQVFNERMESPASDSKTSKAKLVVGLTALPLLLIMMIIILHQDSMSDVVGVSAEEKAMERKAPNVTAPDLKNDSSPSINGFSPPCISKKSGSIRNDSSRSINGFSPPCVGEKSCSSIGNDSSHRPRMPNEELLDGLLAPGFDAESCISRYQSILYRKASPYKPSSYLISRLRSYENLHRRCGPSTKSYNRAVKQFKSTHRIGATSCKYVVWIPANGLGNRMISMASSFLYALMTNRILLVDHGRDMADLFCEPFANSSSWLLPHDFPLKHQFGSRDLRIAHSFGSMMKNDEIRNVSYLFLNLDHSDYHQDKMLFYCDQSQALLQNVPWLMLLSDQHFAPSFFMSKSFKEEVSKLFPERETVFHHLGRYLFHPSNQAWGLITRFYNAYLSDADERIGLQVRVFKPTATTLQTTMDQILACTLEKKLMPQVITQKLAKSPPENRLSKAILVVSLHSMFYENISNMYWSRATGTGEVVRVYQPSHDEHQKFSDSGQNMKAWAEMYLLSLSDVLVTSARSTFGYVAQGLGGLRPWILRRGNGETVPSPACQLDISMDPCFHYPPTYDCQAKKKVEAGNLLPYLRNCKDLNRGVKLVRYSETS